MDHNCTVNEAAAQHTTARFPLQDASSPQRRIAYRIFSCEAGLPSARVLAEAMGLHTEQLAEPRWFARRLRALFAMIPKHVVEFSSDARVGGAPGDQLWLALPSAALSLTTS
jgi:hypothetical protein